MQAILLSFIIFACWSANAQAAIIEAVSRVCFLSDACTGNDAHPDTILIRGLLAKGDAAKFHDLIAWYYHILSDYPVIRFVILRSNGGDVTEAMAIGRDIRKLLLETEGPDLDFKVADPQTRTYMGGDYALCTENGLPGSEYTGSRFKGTECSCTSACFLIYAAGARRSLSYVGIHRVYLDRKTYGDMGLDEAAKTYARIKQPLTEYLNEMGVSRRYADIMLQTSSQDIYVPRYTEIMTEFLGWIPEIEEWIIAKCRTISDKQVEQDKWRALQSHQLPQWMAFSKAREGCIFDAIQEDRVKRLKEYSEH
jgi:hypothetical protein